MTLFVRDVLLAKRARSYGVKRDRWRWRRLTASLCDPYRPELHYMRGPGPKWREKHGQSARFAILAAASVRAPANAVPTWGSAWRAAAPGWRCA